MLWTHLHGGVVHNHALECDLGVLGRHLLAALQEQPVPQLPAGSPGVTRCVSPECPPQPRVPTHMMFALCTAVTLRRAAARARRNA